MSRTETSPRDHLVAMAETIRSELAMVRGTKKAMSEQTGIGLRTLDRYVSGERDIPYSLLPGIAGALGLTVAELVALATQRAERTASQAGP